MSEKQSLKNSTELLKEFLNRNFKKAKKRLVSNKNLLVLN